MISSAELIYLARLVRRPEAIIFIGSGASTWSGLPTWTALLAGLIDHAESNGHDVTSARNALRSKLLLKAADEIPTAFRKADITRTMRQHLNFGKAQPHHIHKLITGLGCTNFVTTNYDGLIEHQLTLDGVRPRYLLATSSRIAEMADIVKANSRNFIFKPHGDLDDAASIVLSSTHYEEIMSNPSNKVRRTLETLFLTRPILFIGYSLNDPDTELLLRAIHRDYGGEAGELHAILPWTSTASSIKRWDDLRVRTFSYPVVKTPNGSDDHQGLLDLLERLAAFESGTIITPPPLTDPYRSLGMYAARYLKPKPAFVLPTRVYSTSWLNMLLQKGEAQYDGSKAETVIERFSSSFILEGSAGSGKSFAINSYISQAAKTLQTWISSGRHSAPPPIPVLLDARLYGGNFGALAATTIPQTLKLEALSAEHEIVLLVDSIDEMPAEFLETASWRKDLEIFSRNLIRSRIVYGTRRHSLVDRHQLPVFHIAHLASDVVDAALSEVGIHSRDLSEEISRALRTPFVVGLARKFPLSIAKARSAAPLYDAFIDAASKKVIDICTSAQLRRQLTSLAVEAVGSGRDTLPIDRVASQLTANLPDSTPGEEIELGRKMLDQLVAAGLFDSQIDQNVRFAHRSVAEYLASHSILEDWIHGTLDVRKVMSDRRWDDTFAFAAASMNPSQRASLLNTVLAIDFSLGLRIASVAETEREKIWRSVLEYAKSSARNYDLFLGRELSAVPEELDEILYELVTERDDTIGRWAATQLRPSARKFVDRFFDDVERNLIRFNCAQELGEAIGSSCSPIHQKRLRSCLLKCHSDHAQYSEDRQNWQHTLPFLIRGLPNKQIPHFLRWAKDQAEPIRNVVVEGITKRKGISVSKFLRSQFEAANSRLLFEMSLGNSISIEIDSTLDESIIERISQLISSSSYTLRGFVRLLREQPHFRALSKDAIKTHHPQLEYVWDALFSEQPEVAAAAVEYLLKCDSWDQATQGALQLLLMKNIGIVINADVFIAACKKWQTLPKRDARWHVSSAMPFYTDFTIRPLKKVISFAHSALEEATPNVDFHGILSVIRGQVDRLAGTEKLDILYINERIPDSFLATIVSHLSGITTDDLDEETQGRLLQSWLGWRKYPIHHPGHLGQIATASFIESIVMPYAKKIASKNTAQKKMIEELLSQAGRANGSRYFPPWAEDRDLSSKKDKAL